MSGFHQALEGPWKKPAPLLSLPSLPSLGALGTSLDEFAEDFKVSMGTIKVSLFMAVCIGSHHEILLATKKLVTLNAVDVC